MEFESLVLIIVAILLLVDAFWQLPISHLIIFQNALRNMQKSSTITQLIESDERLQRLYTFHKKLSNGCFGYLFLVTNKLSTKRNALKVEIIKSESSVTLKK